MLTATAATEKKSADTKVPLEKKLDKRGLLNLGYGYGINGLDLGYLGKSDFGPAAYISPEHHHHDLGAYGYGGPYVADVTKTITLVKNVPVPYEKHIAVPVAVEKPVPYPVKVPVPQPYEVIKHVPGK